MKTASYYKSAFNNGLTLTGGRRTDKSQWLGDKVQWANLIWKIICLLIKMTLEK